MLPSECVRKTELGQPGRPRLVAIAVHRGGRDSSYCLLKEEIAVIREHPVLKVGNELRQ